VCVLSICIFYFFFFFFYDSAVTHMYNRNFTLFLLHALPITGFSFLSSSSDGPFNEWIEVSLYNLLFSILFSYSVVKLRFLAFPSRSLLFFSSLLSVPNEPLLEFRTVLFLFFSGRFPILLVILFPKILKSFFGFPYVSEFSFLRILFSEFLFLWVPSRSCFYLFPVLF
jgi:hypothetical protein